MFFAARRIHIAPDKGSLKDVIDYLSIALKLGFEDPKVYYIRASAYFCHHNFGLVMEDINIAINMIKNEPHMLFDSLNLRALTLQKIGNFKEAHEDLAEIMKLEKTGITDLISNIWLSSYGSFYRWREEIYQRVTFEWKYQSTEKNRSDSNIFDTTKFIMALLILNESLPKYRLDKDGKPREYHRGNSLEKEMPEIAPILKKIIGDDMWFAAKRGEIYSANITFDNKN
jgi:hypothetical protein